MTRAETKKIIIKMMKQAPKDKGVNMPRFYVPVKNAVHQVDLLFLPTDKGGFKYLLVCVDVFSRKVDCQPLKNKSAASVLSGIKKIYSRPTLDFPQKIEVDSGSEFNEPFSSFMKDKNILIRVAKEGRHRQQGIVERYNEIIGKALFTEMNIKELETGKISKEWLKYYKGIIKEINKKDNITKVKNNPPMASGSSKQLLSIGDKVLVQLDNPKTLMGEKLKGKFRAGDVKYSPIVRVIKEIILKPNSPPMYLLNGHTGDRNIEPVAYTKNQLLLLSPDEVKKMSIYNKKNYNKYSKNFKEFLIKT
jgi:hypothetical protein